MKLFGAGTDSGTFDYFTEQINGEEGRSRSDYSPSEDDNVTVQGVSGDKGNMGYFGLSYALENEGKVKTLEVDDGDGCVAPTNETVQDGTYKPLSRPLFIYPSGKALQNETTRRVRPVLRGQLRHDRRAGEVRPVDGRAGAAVEGRRRAAGGVVGSSGHELKQ